MRRSRSGAASSRRSSTSSDLTPRHTGRSGPGIDLPRFRDPFQVVRHGNPHQGLNKNYYSEGKTIAALDHVDLTIPANRIFTLLGPSGCGKTTLLRCIVGLEMPDSGEIAIGDEVVFSTEKGICVPPEKRGLGMVFQTYAIWPHMNVFDNVAYPLQTRNDPREEIVRKVAKTLHFVQLDGFEKRPATKLSGGQQQRVALARALVAEPKVILFDEPLSNLDAKLREETRKELRAFLTELKITAVYVTHDRIEALSLSDTVAVMKSGRIVEMGTPREIYFDSDRRFVADFIGRANFIEGRVAAGRRRPTRSIDSAIGPIACEKKIDGRAGSGGHGLHPAGIHPGARGETRPAGATSSGARSNPWSSSATPTRGRSGSGRPC